MEKGQQNRGVSKAEVTMGKLQLVLLHSRLRGTRGPGHVSKGVGCHACLPDVSMLTDVQHVRGAAL
jgi:hypothetical protein